MRSVNLLDSSRVKAILSYTALSTRLDGTIDLATLQYIYVRKAAIRLKSFSCYRAISSNCSIALLLA
jgi:hypothetical protein